METQGISRSWRWWTGQHLCPKHRVWLWHGGALRRHYGRRWRIWGRRVHILWVTSIGQWELRGLRGVGLDQASYDEYRWEQLFNAHGVEHYVVKQLAWLRRLPVNEAMWNEIRDLMSLQKSIQLGGPEVRTFEHELWPTCWGDDATFSGAAWGVWTLMKSRRRAYSLTSWPRWDMDGVTQQMNQEKKIRGATHQKKWKSKSKWRWSQRWSQPHLWLRSFQMWWPGHRLTDRWEPEARLAERAELVRSQRARQ